MQSSCKPAQRAQPFREGRMTRSFALADKRSGTFALLDVSGRQIGGCGAPDLRCCCCCCCCVERMIAMMIIGVSSRAIRSARDKRRFW